MVEVLLQWFYILLAATNLTGDLQGAEEPNWRGSTQQAPIVEFTTDRRKRADGFDGDIYNGF